MAAIARGLRRLAAAGALAGLLAVASRPCRSDPPSAPAADVQERGQLAASLLKTLVRDFDYSLLKDESLRRIAPPFCAAPAIL